MSFWTLQTCFLVSIALCLAAAVFTWLAFKIGRLSPPAGVIFYVWGIVTFSWYVSTKV